MVYALDTQTGDEKWSFNTNSTFGDWASVTVYNGVVYAAPRTNQFYAIDAYDGTEVWSKSTLGETGTSPTIVDNTAFFGSSNDRIYALDVNDGQEKWTSELSTNAYTPTTVSDERLYIGLGSRVRALNKNTGEHLWDFSTDFFIRSTPTVYNGTVYFGSSNSMYAVNTTNGDKEWELETAGSVYSSPTVVTGSYSTDSRVLLGTLGHHDQWAEEARSSKPVADFTYAPRQPTAQGDIEFDASASQAPDSEIVQYEWDFSGDDTTDSTGEKTVFSFDEGSHQVTLTVRDDEGNVASTQEIVEVGPERINVSVTASDTEVEVNESTYVTYSVANFLTSDKIDVQLLVDTPSDVDVTSVRGADEGSNQFTATTTLPPSSQEEIRVTLTITGAGTHAISAIADYHVSGNPSNADRTVRSLTITADSTNGEGPSEKEAESSGVGVVSDRTPGFGISESIVALGGASYVMKKRIFDSGEKSD
ncbi:pyrrolo-quinoline quinone repeat-containing protein [Halorubrum californiense DSM 19288]|uniref:Pyrrolo-quinoline quinone repeat-containing protein n=2 Tax=Halorubrum californiense TaxID=416585 RepID=M0EF12_9EURY|nr:pyrrolo-quinoline quinone repeat-containing protein [Halorubrum californiense DSM 19288]